MLILTQGMRCHSTGINGQRKGGSERLFQGCWNCSGSYNPLFSSLLWAQWAGMGATESEGDGKQHTGPTFLLLCSQMDGVDSDFLMLKFFIRNIVCALWGDYPQGWNCLSLHLIFIMIFIGCLTPSPSGLLVSLWGTVKTDHSSSFQWFQVWSFNL